MEVPQKIKNRTTIWSSNPASGYKELKSGSEKEICTPMFVAALFTIAMIWKQPKCPSMDEWIKKMLYIQTKERILFGPRKEGNPVVGYNMDEPSEHYAKWNTSDPVGQILHDSSYMRFLK